jgi:hypothetical protein
MEKNLRQMFFLIFLIGLKRGRGNPEQNTAQFGGKKWSNFAENSPRQWSNITYRKALLVHNAEEIIRALYFKKIRSPHRTVSKI